ncbi:LuxR C-terminal-related transcriptional regulator [Myroides sp. WP-1]|uniref:LuxR C-terminal-related transcriptional regulator n=1 Tax=Myroides sp. WP-1 TaxID=2759944 RepID=UPI0015F7CDD0|nr:LuxR C-terminal-related transcriptional regulator [Myroides sp. WP-1]MBB1140454.1 PAS domain-containing protein [Myroides sp. WP-1]
MNNSTESQWLDLYNKQNARSNTTKKEKVGQQLCTYFFIYDCIEDTILFINSAFTAITGHHTDGFNLNFLIDLIHPADQSYFFENEEKRLAFTNALKFEEHFRYTTKYSYRIQKADATYLRIKQECQALEVDDQGHLAKTLIIHKIQDQKNFCAQNDYKIFDKVHSIYLDLNNDFNLTKRELEILTLIKEGLTSREISGMLNVSMNTILTHRKNILYKTNSSSFIELVKKISCAEY